MTRPRPWIAVIAAFCASVAAGLWLFQSGPRPETTQTQMTWMEAMASLSQDGFERPEQARPLDWPQDHAAHPSARSEAWQMSAHLQGPEGTPVNVQFSMTRIGLVPPASPTGTPPSIWELRDIYRAHLIATDGTQGIAEERFGRGMSGQAGFDDALQQLHFDNWALGFPDGSQTDAWQFTAKAGDFTVGLDLQPGKTPISPEGSDAPFRGYAFTRLNVTGTFDIAGVAQPVTGTAWFEHAWGELPLPGAGPVFSDRLLLHLDSGDDLSVIVSQRSDGRGVPTVDAALIPADGSPRPLGGELSQVSFPRMWQGAQTEWPVVWAIKLDDALELQVAALSDTQEHAFTPLIWSGLVHAEGQLDGRAVRGTGILQLSGERQP